MDLHGDGVFPIYQACKQQGIGHRDLAGLGCSGIGAAVLEVGGDLFVVKSGDLCAVEIDRGRIIINDAAGDLLDLRGVCHVDGRAEEEGLFIDFFGFLPFLVLIQQCVGRISAAQVCNLPILCTKAACGGVPGRIDKLGICPIGAVRKARSRVCAVIQIRPNCTAADL